MSYKPFKMKGMPMLRNFGIGQGVSPYKQGIWGIIGSELAKKGAEGKGDEPEGNVKKEQLADPKSDDKSQKKDDKTSTELLKPGEGEKSDTTGTAILKGLTAGITHGLNAVYGTGTVTPKIKMSDRLKKDKKKSEDSTKSGAERVEDVLGGPNQSQIGAGNLHDFYKAGGGNLPSVSERKEIFESMGGEGNYKGSAKQNTWLLEQLKNK